MMTQFTFDELCKMDDGRVAVAFEHEMKKVVSDISDRPGDQSARSVTLTLRFKPVAPGGTIDEVTVGFAISSSVPAKKSKQYSMGLRGSDQLMVNPESASNWRQATLDETMRPRKDPPAKN